MTTDNLDEEIKALVERWRQSILDKDVEAAASLREDGYTAVLPDGAVLTGQEELAMVASPDHVVDSFSARNVEVRARDDEATAVFDSVVTGDFGGERINARYRYTISFRRTGGAWLALSSRLVAEGPPAPLTADAPGALSALARLVPQALKSRLKGSGRRINAVTAPTFPELAYIPYRPGLDFMLPPSGHEDTGAAELPLPPKELWLGYNYPAHGRTHVEKMMEIVRASDFSFKEGDRVLDFGCGAGRMIRHLRDLARSCEVWGADISAEHVLWCKQNLSPPFNFLTNTKVPHLPFEDKSFQFIYSGSVFTHLDDLADAWLLELRRVLAPGGRLYITIHDRHTVELFESGRYDHAEVVRAIKSREVYQKSKASFGMLVVGRDADAQVFYDTEYFTKVLRPSFDILSVTPEAYFYQTAFLLKRKE